MGDNPNITESFFDARKLAIKEYNKCVSKGEVGYLPSLEGVIKNSDIASEINLGTFEIPMKKIIGTYSHLRSLSFARNFMPLLKEDTEFEVKWTTLCNVHLRDGIRDPIKVYEYLNWYYVIEGNKRVSVLKFFNAYSIQADIIRLIPKKDENDETILIYYKFLKFNKITNIYSIYFSNGESFDLLLDMLEKYNPPLTVFDTKYKYFETYIFTPFRRIYRDNGGGNLSITSSDAFLEYAKIYGIPLEIDTYALNSTMKEFIKELELIANKNTKINVLTSPIESTQSTNVLSAITTLISPKKKLKVAFAYARTIETSGWTYAHELGRIHADIELHDEITTSFIENVPESDEAYNNIKKLAEDGNDVIFTTSPIYMNATLKCSLEYPQTKFFNCSEAHPYQHVYNYYGRTYEPRFLTGIIAGSMTRNNIIGYVATSPTPEVISSINAFTLGAKMVNPYIKVKVEWTNDWNSRIKYSDAGTKLIQAGVDIICNRTLNIPHPISMKFGVYSMLCTIDMAKGKPDKYLATPVWKWGIFYEKILRNVLDDTFRTVVDMYGNNTKLINFWWGLASGVTDIYYSKELVPEETQKLVELLKKMIINNMYHPFTGPILDQSGKIRIEKDEIVSHDQVLSMDWFVDGVDTVVPKINN